MTHVELSEHSLDLGRPELNGLMNRYSGRTLRASTTMLRPPTAVVVPNDLSSAVPVHEALENEGWSVRSCSGPGKEACPLMRGERCRLRESVDAAVVFMDPKPPYNSAGVVTRLRCAGDSASPGVVALEQSLEPTKFGRGVAVATVGALRGPEAILEAIAALLAARESD